MADALLKPVILIVDDETELCDTMALTFDIRGFEVISAYSGKQALELLKQRKVDVLLTDVRMANGNGLELVRWMHEANIKVRVVAFMSGYSDVTPKEISDLGVALFFDKPFPVNTVIKTIRERLETSPAAN